MKKMKIKKFSCAIICAIIILSLAGCSYNKSKAENVGNDYRMTVIYADGFAIIYRDNETGVQYLRVGNGVTPMINTDGTPYTGQ